MLAKIESTFNTDALPVPTTDAFLVGDVDLKVDSTVLERNFFRASLSTIPVSMGRKIVTVTFRHEIKGSGTVGVAPKLGTLLRGCGFAATAVTAGAATQIANITSEPTNTGPAVTFAKTTVPGATGHGRYRFTVVLGGASATAKIRVTGNPGDIDDPTLLNSEEISAQVFGPGTPAITVTVGGTALIPTFTIVGTGSAGDMIVVTLGGYRASYVLTGAEGSVAAIATALTAAISAADPGSLWTEASAAGVVTVTFTNAAAGVVVTTAVTGLVCGANLAVVTPSWTGSLVLGDSYFTDTRVVGVHYSPISANFESLTFAVFFDGALHRVTGARGNVQFTCEAGQLAMASFTFTGQYASAYKAALPTTAVYERSRPAQVELATLALGVGKFLRAQSWTVDMGITIQPRDSVSHSDGYMGGQLTARNPTGGLNPEADSEDLFPAWGYLTTSPLLRFNARVGTTPGNIIRFMSESAQVRNVQYTDRNGNRVFDMSLGFPRDSDAGDDEIRLVAC
jgi:hypothetical protein